jgi:hypothetical protein
VFPDVQFVLAVDPIEDPASADHPASISLVDVAIVVLNIEHTLPISQDYNW